MDWFRSYHGAPSDTKLSLIAIKSGQPRAHVTAVWWEVLDHASRNVTQCHARGDVSQIDPEIIALQQGMDPPQVEAILQAMVAKGMIVGGVVANWDKYQVKRDDPQATERERKQRERDKADGTDGRAPSRNVTQGHAQRRGEESRGEEKEDVDVGRFAFSGKVVRLNGKDYTLWKARFSTFIDFDEELRAVDSYCHQNGIADWFIPVERMLSKRHREVLERRAASAAKPKPKNTAATL